ncbi:MAG TPA: S8 family peptidase [Bryobacteraceae bacterium]|jgi:serine protease AprX
MIKFAVCFAAALGVVFCAPDNRIDPEVNRLGASGHPSHVIVQFREGVEAASYGRFSRQVKYHKSLEMIRSAVYEIRGQDDLQALAADPDVEYIAPDRAISSTAYSGPPDYAWMQTLGITSTFGTAAFDGTGIGVAVIDSGVNPSIEFQDAKHASRITYSANFTTDKDASDGYGHGTFVAGLVAGNGAQSAMVPSFTQYWVRGTAPNATIINLKALNSLGAGSDSTVIAAIQAATKLPASLHVKVINLSLGRPVAASCSADLLCQAVNQAWQLGFVVVVAAGNDGRTASTQGYGTIDVPGNSPYAITVGASNTQGELAWSDAKMASYSSKGPTMIDHIAKPDLVASGNRILSLRVNGSTLDSQFPANEVPLSVYSSAKGGPGNIYFQLSGTSMAAGITSGAVALVLQKNPNYTPDQVKELLMATAYKFPQKSSIATDAVTGVSYQTTYDLFTVGAGDLNVAAALANMTTPPLISMQSPAVKFSSGGSVQLVSPNMSLWGSNAAWGTMSLWGSSVVSSNMSLWGSNSLWGTSGTAAFNSLWGSNAAWGTSTLGADSTTIAINGEN